MQGLAADAVGHLDTERRERIPIVGLFDEKAQSLFYKCIKRFLCREITLSTGYSGPEKRRYIDRIVPGFASHRGQCGSGIIFYGFKFLTVVASRHDITMGTDGNQTERVRLIKITLDPLFVDFIGAAVFGERM